MDFDAGGKAIRRGTRKTAFESDRIVADLPSQYPKISDTVLESTKEMVRENKILEFDSTFNRIYSLMFKK